MNIEAMARIHKALSVPARLEILRLLAQHPSCVNALTRNLRISQPAVSQHLAILRQVRLVRGERKGYRVHYTLETTRLAEFQRTVAALTAEPTAAQGQEKEG